MLNETDIHWFPLRISHSSTPRLMRLKALLDNEDVVLQTFVPMEFRRVSDTSMAFVPAISNLIFVRITLQNLRVIKANKQLYEPLRYIMRTVIDADDRRQSEVLYVADAKMDDFIRVSSIATDQVVFLNNLDFACRPSALVQITEGPFAGVKGRIKSFKKHLCVVIPIEDVAAVAITNVPKKHLIYLPEEAAAPRAS